MPGVLLRKPSEAIRDQENPSMAKPSRLTTYSKFPRFLIVPLGCLLVLPIQMEAQNTGNNAVYNASTVVGSPAFIDASAFANGTDICAVLYSIISGTNYAYPPTGAVVDARGLNVNNASNDGIGDLTCAYSPWTSSSNGTLNPATILLPLTQIVIGRSWAMPNGSRIVGKAPGFAPQAALQASTGFSGTSMIQMGTSCPTDGCTGVSVEHLTLDAHNLSIDTIDNFSSREQSYVDDVNLKNVGGTAIGINIQAANSGPYSNIRFTAAPCTQSGCSTPAAVDIYSQTKGVHGMTAAGPCVPNNSSLPCVISAGHAAIYVNASNNSVEDVHVEGFWDAIEVGAVSAVTVSNVTVANVNGASSGYGKVQNTVHICGPLYN